MTMYALLVVKDATQIVNCIHGTGDGGSHVGPKAFQDTLKRAGVTPSYGKGMPLSHPGKSCPADGEP